MVVWAFFVIAFLGDWNENWPFPVLWPLWKWKWSCSVVSDSLRPMDCSLSGSSVHGIFQARVLEWIAISFSRGSSWPRNRTWVSRIAGRCFTVWATEEAYFPNLLAYWVQHFKASSFRIWNSSTAILSPPLSLFIVMLPKAHLTLHSRMSGSRWVNIPPWLCGSWRSFLYCSSVYSYHLPLISSASVRSIPYLSFIVPIFACSLNISNFLEDISSLSHCIVFLYFFVLITE